MTPKMVTVELRQASRTGDLMTAEIEGLLIGPNAVLLPNSDGDASYSVSKSWPIGDGRWFIDVETEEYIPFEFLKRKYGT